ncbi:DEAD/DEAH box helicase [Lactobacillus sp. S2-2]|uniref:DEAD/DEAH box helicase n=1 Tax=Lactobacillus sp. S2-2 TaxID=2692917 RepID=UPI001F3C6A43|nr:DEAD/DEAH box helicase [Lactobacillus sp. S2-2]MCF6514816.1 DEAD/DEAH box helicase [Lactobacillus sp. S2-2]
MIEQFKEKFQKQGYQNLTPIQEAVYKLMVDGNDIIGLSPTGSGKTVAFTLPVVSNLTAGDGIQAMVIEPSQELAMQTTNVMRDWAKDFDLKVLSLIGGANVKRQHEQLKKRPEIVIGTPGRIMSLINEKRLKTNLIKQVVVDEADDLLQEGSLVKVQEIVTSFENDFQISYFSATETDVLHNVDKYFGRSAEIIDVRNIDKTRGNVKHGLFEISRGKRNEMLKRFLNIPNFRALVFVNQNNSVQKVFNYFKHLNLNSVKMLSADQNKIDRKKALDDFRMGRIKLLITTDVAARGLDIEKLPVVINFDLPDNANNYIHRVGRTGRMGEPGLVINFGDDHDLRDLKKMLKDSEYNLTKIFYYNQAIVDEVEETNDNNAEKHRSKSVKKSRLKDNDFKVKKEDITKNNPVKKKKNRKRNQKNKGKRKNN